MFLRIGRENESESELVTSFVLYYSRFHHRVKIVSVMSFDGEKLIQFFSKTTSDSFL